MRAPDPAPRPHDHQVEPLYSGLSPDAPPPPGDPQDPVAPEDPAVPWPELEAPAPEPAGIGGLCGLLILLVAAIVIGSFALMFFGP